MPRLKKPLGIYKPTANHYIRGRIRQIFLTSRERAYAMKRDDYTCQKCFKRMSKKKGHEVYMDVHHLDEIGKAWEEIFEIMKSKILCHPDKLQCLCRECHKGETNKIKIEGSDSNSF